MAGAQTAAEGMTVISSDASVTKTGYECALQLPMPDAASAQVILSVLAVEPAVEGTAKSVQLWTHDKSGRTVVVNLNATSVRSLRAAVNAILSQSKLIVRTMRAFPAKSKV